MLARAMKALHENPVLFVKKILHAEPDAWQEEVLNALAANSRVAVRSGHGVGKSCLESWALLWFLTTRPFPKVVATAPTVRQLYDVLWAEISKWLKRSEMMSELFEWQKTFVRLKAAPERWFAAARTAARPENLAGFHAQSILFILDEASGVDDSIFEAVEGALTTPDAKLLLCGNPTKNSGFFKRAFFEDRELYQTFKVSSTESGRVSKEYAERLIKQYGADSDVVRVRVFGEFPKAESDGLIALEWVEAAMNREPEVEGELVIGVDVARFGDDETVIQPRIGNSALKFEHYRKADTMATVGRVIHTAERLMEQYNCRSAKINVDDDGVGGGVTDRLREVVSEKNLNMAIKGCHNGGKARDGHYMNWGTESYFALRDRLQAGEITLPRDDEMAAQLTTRKYKLTSTDKLALEDKGSYKRRVGRSPDRADALVLAFAPTAKPLTKIPQMPIVQSYWRQ